MHAWNFCTEKFSNNRFQKKIQANIKQLNTCMMYIRRQSKRIDEQTNKLKTKIDKIFELIISVVDE